MDIKKVKRERCANFNPIEVRLLTDIVCRYRTIIENKKTDAVTNKKKEVAWEKITQIFNASSRMTARSAKTLRLKYEGLKKEMKKKRQELYKTGVGESSAMPFTDVEEKVLNICSNMHGLDSLNDSEPVIQPVVNDVSTEIQKMEMIEIPREETETGQTKEALDNVADKTEVLTTSEDNILSAMDNNFGCDVSGSQWKPWASRNLKSRVNPVLKKQFTKNSIAVKFNELSTSCLELVNLQIQLARNEIDYRKAEHNLLMQQRKEEHEVRMVHLHNEEERRLEEYNNKKKNYIKTNSLG